MRVRLLVARALARALDWVMNAGSTPLIGGAAISKEELNGYPDDEDPCGPVPAVSYTPEAARMRAEGAARDPRPLPKPAEMPAKGSVRERVMQARERAGIR